MGKVNRKLKAKAKKAIAAVAGKNQHGSKQFPQESDEEKALLHKTQTGRETITKKEKIRKKHKNFIEKFKNIAKQKKEEAAKKKRQETAITGDLKPLKDALPSLDELFMMSKDRSKLRTGVEDSNEEPAQKISAKKKLNKKKRDFVSKVNAFEALLKDPDFKKNPRATISYHVKYTNGLIDK